MRRPSPTHRELIARLAANTQRLRTERGWTQEEAAAQCSLATHQYQRLETARTGPTFASVARLADGFKVDAQDLLAPAVAPPKRRPGRPRQS